MLDNVRAYTAGCFQQCFLSFRFALPSLLQEGKRDQLLREQDNTGSRSGSAGGRVVKRKRIRMRAGERSMVVNGERHKGRSLKARRYDFSFNNHGSIIPPRQMMLSACPT